MAIDDLIFLHWNRDPRCRATVDKYFEGYHTIQIMTRGEIVIAYDDHTQVCAGRWLWPAFPGPRIRFHNHRASDSWHHRYVAFQGPRVQAWRAGGIWPERPQALENDGAVETMDAIHAELARLDRWGQLRAINLLEGLLIDCAAERHADQREPWLAVALEELDRCRDLRPDCDAVAAACGLTSVVFRRRFKAQMGCSPTAYVRERRIARARELLAGSDANLATIADQLGYADQYYFARHFKRVMGVPPGRYRASVQT